MEVRAGGQEAKNAKERGVKMNQKQPEESPWIKTELVHTSSSTPAIFKVSFVNSEDYEGLMERALENRGDQNQSL